MSIELIKVLLNEKVKDCTKYELINKVYSDKEEDLADCIKIKGIHSKFKIRMLNYLMKKLIKQNNNEALATIFLILSHDEFSKSLKRASHAFLKIYNECQLKKFDNNKKMLKKLLERF